MHIESPPAQEPERPAPERRGIIHRILGRFGLRSREGLASVADEEQVIDPEVQQVLDRMKEREEEGLAPDLPIPLKLGPQGYGPVELFRQPVNDERYWAALKLLDKLDRD
jgi:hypothetical protein